VLLLSPTSGLAHPMSCLRAPAHARAGPVHRPGQAQYTGPGRPSTVLRRGWVRCGSLTSSLSAPALARACITEARASLSRCHQGDIRAACHDALYLHGVIGSHAPAASACVCGSKRDPGVVLRVAPAVHYACMLTPITDTLVR
jgi:hypothetical protein